MSVNKKTRMCFSIPLDHRLAGTEDARKGSTTGNPLKLQQFINEKAIWPN